MTRIRTLSHRPAATWGREAAKCLPEKNVSCVRGHPCDVPTARTTAAATNRVEATEMRMERLALARRMARRPSSTSETGSPASSRGSG